MGLTDEKDYAKNLAILHYLSKDGKKENMFDVLDW
jgi:hypothetical protein